MDQIPVLACSACGAVHLPPRRRCRSCGGDSLQEHAIDNAGELYAFTVIRVPPARYAGQEYTVAAARFAGGLVITGRLVEEKDGGTPLSGLEPGRAVRLASRDGRACRLQLA